MKILLDIPDNKVEFALRVLRSLNFVKNAKAISIEKAELITGLKDSFEQIKLHKEGKIKLQDAKDFLNEL